MHHAEPLSTIHVALALIIMSAYLAIPFTALRRIPLTPAAKIAGSLFFITCGITHLGIAAGFHTSPLMVINDAIQAISSASFIFLLSRIVSYALDRKRAAPKES